MISAVSSSSSFAILFLLAAIASLGFVAASSLGRIPTAAFHRVERGDTSSSSLSSSSSSPSSSLQVRDPSLLQTRAGAATAGFVAPPLEPLSYYLRIALAGGLAGATGSAVLYPIDSAKTLRQSNPKAYRSVKDALCTMLRSKHALQRVYRGIGPAALGAIPSSALYFGAYESSKVALQRWVSKHPSSHSHSHSQLGEHGYRTRMVVHGLAAASGNVLSSFVFVPKEVIKQQLQIRSSGGGFRAIGNIVRDKGISGLYAGYGATLLRNIPSATIRFVLYEELKRKWASSSSSSSSSLGDGSSSSNDKLRAAGTFLAGAVAGSTSSFVMTPIDVVKTRMATGSCPLGVRSCMLHVIQETGWKGLYAGAGSRVLWSGAFSAIGFGTFELVKGCLGVSASSSASNNNNNANAEVSSTTKVLPASLTTKTASPLMNDPETDR